MHILGGKSNVSGQSWPQFALFLDFCIRLQVSQYKISWICLSCSEAELIFWVARKFLGWTPGADPDRCNRCKCIGQSHMIDNLGVCAQDFLSDANHFNFPNAPKSLLPLLLRSNLVTSDSGTKAMADN